MCSQRRDTVPKTTNFLDFDGDFIAVCEIARRVHTFGNPRWGPGRDDVARFQCHSRADIGDQLSDAEDHVVGTRGLPHLAIYGRANLELLWVCDLVAGHDPGTARRVGIGGLPFKPLV